LGALLIATAANADIASVDYVTNGLAGKQDASTIGTVNSDNMGTDATTVVAAIKEVATEAAAAQTAANTAKTNAATAQSTADTAKANAATAQTTANTAKTNAATAQTTADSALTKANAAVVANNAIQAGTGTKITYDAKGLVTGSSSLTASDIPTLSINKVSGLQTALNEKQNASTAVRLTTTGEAVGDVKTPVYVSAGGVVTPITSYGGLAAQATKDGSGNVITTTYATKTELAGKQDKLVVNENITASNGVAIEQGQDGKLTIKGTGASSTAPGVLKLHNNVTGDDVDGTVTQYAIKTALADKQVAAPMGESGDNFYVTNNDGAWVDMFTAMPKDPECAEEKCALTYKAGKYAWEVVRE